MKRDHIDRAILAQICRMEAMLRDVLRSGGKDTWPHLASHGHKFPTVRSALLRGLLKRDGLGYEITREGQWLVESNLIDHMDRTQAIVSHDGGPAT